MAKKKRSRAGPDSWSRRSKYPKEFRERVAEEALAAVATGGKGTISEVARRHGLEPKTAMNWVNRLRADRVAEGPSARPEMDSRYASNPAPRPVTVTPPESHKRQRILRSPEVKAAAVARAQQIGATAAGREMGFGNSAGTMITQWADKAGVTLPKFQHSHGKITTTTLLSRPGPPLETSEPQSNGHAIERRPPSRKRAEQQPLFTEQEPQRVTATPDYDAAEQARQQALDELKDSVTRQALKERDALKTVFEMFFREKLQP